VRAFLLGVGTTLAVVALAGFVLLLTLGSGPGSPTGGASALPTAAPPPSPTAPPADLGPDETWLGAVELRSQDVVAPEGSLVDVVAVGSGVRFGDDGLLAERLRIDATVPFAAVAEQVGQDVVVYDAGGGLAGVQRTVTLLGRETTVRATGTVVADGGELLIEPQAVDLGGPAFLDAAASSLARALVTIRQPIEGVPQGMALTGVAVTPEGFDAVLVGQDVVISR
jgi:hypothetical protein